VRRRTPLSLAGREKSQLMLALWFALARDVVTAVILGGHWFAIKASSVLGFSIPNRTECGALKPRLPQLKEPRLLRRNTGRRGHPPPKEASEALEREEQAPEEASSSGAPGRL
jgi:hypothetical protein